MSGSRSFIRQRSLSNLRRRSPIVWALSFTFLLLSIPESYAKKWLLGVSGVGGMYAQKQADWNVLLSSEGDGAPQFSKKTQLYFGGQLDFIHLDFAGRFMLGLRYERLSESVSSAQSHSTNRAHLFLLTDTFYFFPIQNGFNLFIRLGLGYITGKGTYSITATNSTLKFSGNYFTGFATGGFEIMFWHFAVSVEAGYRYAVIPRNTINQATGTSFSGASYTQGSTLMINTGGGKKFKLDYSGVFYGLQAKLYF